MIDLHIHSNNSDGTDSVEEILQKATERNLHYISITDHDNCDAYDELKKIPVNRYFSGTIIRGIELKCAYQGKVIEVLGYNYNLNKMKKLLKIHYPKHEILQEKYLKHFYNACGKMGLTLTPIEQLKWDKNKDWATILIYNEIKKYPENKEKCPEKMWESLESFRYNYLYNSETEFYIDKTKDYPSLEECISIIHKAKGKAFLAHMFVYDWATNKIEFISDILHNYNLDGIETFYSRFTNEQSEFIYNLCEEKNLYKSGGSDYHGTNKPGINIGIGFGNLQIPDYILTDWYNKKRWYKTFFKKKRLMLTEGIMVK